MKKIIILISFLTMQFCLMVSVSFATTGYPGLKRFGFLYELAEFYTGGAVVEASANWAADRFDIIIGMQAQNLTTVDGERMPVLLYDFLKARNASIKLYSYTPFAAMYPGWISKMEEYCVAHSLSTEDLYYHYYEDADTKCADADGFPGGTATDMEDARVYNIAFGSCAATNPCPTSSTFSLAFQYLAEALVTVDTGKYMDGLMLDSFQATAERAPVWAATDDMDLHLTHEVRDAHCGGLTCADKEIAYTGTAGGSYLNGIEGDLVTFTTDLQTYLRTATSNPAFVVDWNVALPTYYATADGIKTLFINHVDGTAFMYPVFEYILSGSFATSTVENGWKKIYTDMEAGNVVLGQVTTVKTVAEDAELVKTILSAGVSAHWLLNHANYYSSLKVGGAIYTCVGTGVCEDTFWDPRWEINIGSPKVQSDYADVWGNTGTSKFYVFVSNANYKIYARNYTDGVYDYLVLLKISTAGGIANAGTNSASHNLPVPYSRLQYDKTWAAPSGTVDLAYMEGAILRKALGQISIGAGSHTISIGGGDKTIVIGQ